MVLIPTMFDIVQHPKFFNISILLVILDIVLLNTGSTCAIALKASSIPELNSFNTVRIALYPAIRVNDLKTFQEK